MTTKSSATKKAPAKPGRGGARKGAGRPPKPAEEATAMYSIRVPKAWIPHLRKAGTDAVRERLAWFTGIAAMGEALEKVAYSLNQAFRDAAPAIGSAAKHIEAKRKKRERRDSG